MSQPPDRAPRVLLVDDDPALLDVLALLFEDAGFIVRTASDGRAALADIEARRPDAIVADVNMPVMDGFTLCRRLRSAGLEVPIVLLTSRDTEVDETLGLELGADDYVVKPFRGRALVARVRARLRRTRAADRRAVRGDLVLDPERFSVTWRDAPVEVTVSEFRLLAALTRRPGVVLGRDRLLDQMRGDDSVVGERIVDTYVRRLRRKFEAIEPGFDRIRTVVGAGYRWADDR